MAHTVIGIDLGAHAVKVVLIEVGFRVFRVVSVFEEPVGPGEAPLEERQDEALAAVLAKVPSESTAYVAIPGELLAVRVLDLPFSEARKIDQVVGYELEGQIVHPLSEVVFDYAILTAPRAPGSAVIGVAARTEDLAALLAAHQVRGVEPRALFAAPLVYQALFDGGRTPDAADLGTRLLIDFGHQRTNFCFLWRGETVYARTITRGGAALTAGLAEAFRCSIAQAEEAKHQHALLGSARRLPEGPVAQRMDVVLREALGPWLRELRQTLASYRARDKAPLDGILLTGGGAALGGLPEHLEEELGLPVALFAPDLGLTGPDSDDRLKNGRFSQAAAIARAGARGQKEIDLRRGPFEYRANFSLLRQKAAHLGVLVAALVVSATLDGAMTLTRLTKQRDQLQAQLKSATQELFGEPRMDAKKVAIELKRGFREDMAPIPKASAFDLLGEISRRVPSAERIRLDVTDLDIRPKKTVIQGTVDSAAAVDEMVGRLKEIDCFEEITKGPITEVSGGAKRFSLNIASRCP